MCAVDWESLDFFLGALVGGGEPCEKLRFIAEVLVRCRRGEEASDEAKLV